MDLSVKHITIQHSPSVTTVSTFRLRFHLSCNLAVPVRQLEYSLTKLPTGVGNPMHFSLAGALGIEPRTTDSKSVVIPLHYAPTTIAKFLKNSWLGTAHLMFPAQLFAFQRALRFETTRTSSIPETLFNVKDFSK